MRKDLRRMDREAIILRSRVKRLEDDFPPVKSQTESNAKHIQWAVGASAGFGALAGIAGWLWMNVMHVR